MSALLGVLESKLGQAVLGDLHRAAGLLHLLAQSFQVGDGQTGIAERRRSIQRPRRTTGATATTSRFSALSTLSLHIEPGG